MAAAFIPLVSPTIFAYFSKYFSWSRFFCDFDFTVFLVSLSSFGINHMIKLNRAFTHNPFAPKSAQST